MVSTDKKYSAKTNTTITPYYMLSTVTEDKEFYTCGDIEVADRARRYPVLLDCLATSAFKTYVKNNFLIN